MILKTSKEVYLFWQVKVRIFWKCIQYFIHWDKTQMLNKNSFRQSKRYKNCPLFFSRASTRHITFNLQFVCGFSIFDSVLFLLIFFIFVQQNGWTPWLWNVITPFKIKLIEKPNFPPDIEILGWCPAGPVLSNGEKVSL